MNSLVRLREGSMFGNDDGKPYFDEDRRVKDRQKTTELMERILNQYGELNSKFDAFMDKYTVPLEYVKEELEKKKRRDVFIDKVQESVTVWIIVGVLTGIAAVAAWLGKLAIANLKQM
jgi:hypothetical protein